MTTPVDREGLVALIEQALIDNVRLADDVDYGAAHLLADIEDAGLAIVPREPTGHQATAMRHTDMLASDRPAHKGSHWYDQMYVSAIAASPYRSSDDG